MSCIAIQDGRGETLYCAIVSAMQGGVSKQGGIFANNSTDSWTGLGLNESLVKANLERGSVGLLRTLHRFSLSEGGKPTC